MIDETNVAAEWLAGLARRGVAVAVRNGRVVLHPASAYKALSDDELLVLRHHRQAIKDAVRAGLAVQVAAPTTSDGAVPTPAPAPKKPCAYCYRAPCIGIEHPAFATLHARDEQEQWRQRRLQRERDMHEWSIRQRYGLPAPTWDL